MRSNAISLLAVIALLFTVYVGQWWVLWVAAVLLWWTEFLVNLDIKSRYKSFLESGGKPNDFGFERSPITMPLGMVFAVAALITSGPPWLYLVAVSIILTLAVEFPLRKIPRKSYFR